jgi:Succinylglutamate desuccinylase / Aspartoacylase family
MDLVNVDAKLNPAKAPASLLASRILGRYGNPNAGKRVIAVFGMHGNEPAGGIAAERVLLRLRDANEALNGELVVVAGNLSAMRASVRYHETDLNRLWTEEKIELAAAKTQAQRSPEEREQQEILSVVLAELKTVAPEQTVLIDLHTTSATGIPFVIFGDTLPQRKFARVYPIPSVLGLEEQVVGVLSSYFSRRGCTTFAVEGGQHTDPGSVDNLEAVLWLTLSRAGVILRAAFPEVANAAKLLDAKRSDLPRVLEVTGRRAITSDDKFVMQPGFRNLDYARKEQLLAQDVRGEVRAEEDGMVILPLYQGLGNDGYFWGRALSSTELRVSLALRSVGAAKLLRTLPGVSEVAPEERAITLTEGARRLYPARLLRLLGLRKHRVTKL